MKKESTVEIRKERYFILQRLNSLFSMRSSTLTRNIILFIISMLMVIGFCGHGQFYQLGAIPLVLLGGGAVFIVLRGIAWASGSTTLGKHSAGTLLFPPDDVKLVQYGSKTITIRPLRKTRMRAGSVYDAKLKVTSEKSFAHLLVTDVYRKRLGELTEEDAEREGLTSLSELRKRWEASYGKWDDDDIIRVIEFRAMTAFGRA